MREAMHENGLKKTLDIVDGVAGGGDAGRLGREGLDWIRTTFHGRGESDFVVYYLKSLSLSQLLEQTVNHFL